VKNSLKIRYIIVLEDKLGGASMEIKLLVSSCINCKLFEKRLLEAIEKQGIYADIEKIDYLPDTIKYGVAYLPALVVNGRVVSSGKILSTSEIVRLIH
jgi:hypothetical protein